MTVAITKAGVVVSCMLAAVLCLGTGARALADESDEIVGVSGSTQMTIEVLDQPAYDLVPQSEPKTQSGVSADSVTGGPDEPIYPDMPQTGSGTAWALVGCACALGTLVVGLEGRR